MAAAVVAREAFLGALERASTIDFSAYVLRRDSPVTRALERAAGRGAAVAVTLEGAPFGGSSAERGRIGKQNRRAAAELARHGVHVHVTRPAEGQVHMKAAIVDGTVFLDDRNWPADGRDTIVATSDPEDLRTVARALRGEDASDANLATGKSEALELEAQAIYAAAGDRIDVESESFGSSPVSKALRYRAEHGAVVRLLVAASELGGPSRATERAELRHLREAGVDVRVVNAGEKLCAGADCGWVGSANATYSFAPQADWGMLTRDAALLGALHAAFERNWDEGRTAAL